MKNCLEKFITNFDKELLQIAAGTLLQITTGITNRDSRTSFSLGYTK